MAKWSDKNQEKQQHIGDGRPGVDEAKLPKAEFAAGQIWEGVIVPNRPINLLSFCPGSRLPPLVLEGDCGGGRWQTSVLGESCQKVMADEEMLRTGKVRA